MKTILVPIDFSEACDNALNYAVAFAKKTNAQIHLLSVYDYALVSSDPLIMVPPPNEMMDEQLKKLEDIGEKIQATHGKGLDVTFTCEAGTVIETINTYVKRHHIELIIMGMQGGGFISEKIIGSTTSSLMRRAACPVLGIPKQTKFNEIRQIVLATDHEAADYQGILDPLKAIIRVFDAHLYVLYVIEPKMKLDKGVVTGIQVNRALHDIPYTAHTVAEVDVEIAVDQFVEDRSIDLAVIIPRKHSFFYTLFHESNTKKLAFHTKVPLLAVHE